MCRLHDEYVVTSSREQNGMLLDEIDESCFAPVSICCRVVSICSWLNTDCSYTVSSHNTCKKRGVSFDGIITF